MFLLFFAVFCAGLADLGTEDIFSVLSVLAEWMMLMAVYFYLYYQGRYMVNRVDVGLWFSACLRDAVDHFQQENSGIWMRRYLWYCA